MAALSGAGGGASGGGGLGTLSWANIYGSYAGSNPPLTIPAIPAAHTLTATKAGPGMLSYLLNGSSYAYSGGFAVHAGDALAWLVASSGGAGQSGSVTVNDASNGGALVGSFNYILTERLE